MSAAFHTAVATVAKAVANEPPDGGRVIRKRSQHVDAEPGIALACSASPSKAGAQAASHSLRTFGVTTGSGHPRYQRMRAVAPV
jgi:hypothetical protein